AALLAVIGLAALLTVPLSAWGLAATWERRWNRGATTALGVLVLLWTAGSWRTARAAAIEDLPTPGGPSHQGFEINDAVMLALPSWTELPELPPPPQPPRTKDGVAPTRIPSLFTTEPVACVPSPDARSTGEGLAVLTYLVPASAKTLERRKRSVDGRKLAAAEAVSRCVRAPAEALPQAIADQLRAEALRGPVKIDVITGVTLMRSQGFILDMLALRPGLDGICDADRCLMPWQLTADNHFIHNEPLPWIPDFRFGVSPVRLQKALGGSVPNEVLTWDRHRRRPKTRPKDERDQPLPTPEGAQEWSSFDGLLRIATVSIATEASGRPHMLARLHERRPPLSQERLRQAQDRAEDYIAAAQLEDGRFTYTLDPFTGARQTKSWNLPRQAGTTLVMCELGRDEQRTRTVAALSLEFMAQHARRPGEQDMLALVRGSDKHEAHLGSTALPAIAFLACRPRVGDAHDRLIAGLIRFLMAMQREDGSFYPIYDTKAQAVIDGPEPMYAGGQAIFAMSLAEKLALEEPDLAAAMGLPEAGEI
ncbi:MAG: hypothetical protein KC431_23585, partial [Myxococcales bacterium]|nr:hypothetical protein [Myxococcales bacterium]